MPVKRVSSRPLLDIAGRGSVAANAALAVLAALLLAFHVSAAGRITVNDGAGWDGADYLDMVESGWNAGTANTALRPMVILLNRPAHAVLRDSRAAFRVMNYVYAALLAFALALLFDRYSSDGLAKALLIVNVFLSIAVAKYPPFYPYLVDLGAAAVQALAVYLIVSGRRWGAAVACVAAVLSREFAIPVVLFGIVRDLRRRERLVRVVLTYSPAVTAVVMWRVIVAREWADPDRAGKLLTPEMLLANLGQWLDPVFVAFFVYFLLTVFGGVTLFVFGRFGFALRQFRREPEWLVFIGTIVGAAAVGSGDIWRYLAYLLPAAVVLFAVCTRELGLPRRALTLAAVICAATIVTQHPFQRMDVAAYFRDWFPYYLHLGQAPIGDRLPALWPLWGWRFAATAALLVVLAALPAPKPLNTLCA